MSRLSARTRWFLARDEARCLVRLCHYGFRGMLMELLIGRIIPLGNVNWSLFRALTDCAMNFLQNFWQTVAKFPRGIVFLEFSDVADPPDVVADPVRLFIAPG